MKLKDIDFRIWDNRRKEYIQDYTGIHKLFIFDKDKGDTERAIEITELPNGFEEEFNPIDDGEVEFFTGLYDNNGTKIYEGDIVTIDYTNRLVVFEKGSFVLKHSRSIIGDIPLNILYNNEGDIKLQCVKILGNIHENPELLEKNLK